MNEGNMKEKRKINQLLQKAADSGIIEAGEIALKHGANVNSADRFGLTPLHVAVINNDSIMLEFLIKNGADPEKENISGESPLDWAKKDKKDSLLEKMLNKQESAK